MLDLLRTHAAAASSVPAGVCTACREVLRVDGAAVLLMLDGSSQWQIAATIGELAPALEEAQLTVAEGPAVEAYRSAGPVLVSDLTAAAGRWPGLADLVPAGLGALFSFPLQLGAVRFGVLDMYLCAPASWDSSQLGRALRFADCAAQTLILGVDTAPGEALEWLVGLPGHEPAIDQAAGMSSVHLGVTLSVAYARLRGLAFATNQSLAQVSRSVVAGRLRLTEDRPEEPTGSDR